MPSFLQGIVSSDEGERIEENNLGKVRLTHVK
jgi:hypothetical protein